MMAGSNHFDLDYGIGSGLFQLLFSLKHFLFG